MNVALGDFNAKTTSRYKNGINSYEGLKIDIITSQFGLQQLLNETTNLTRNSSSCIDLIFTSQPNLVMEPAHPIKVNALFVDQSISSPGITDSVIQMWIKKYFYLISHQKHSI